MTLIFNDLSLERQVGSLRSLSAVKCVMFSRPREYEQELLATTTSVFVFQFRLSEVKGLHHSVSCLAVIFVTLFIVQMLVSAK